MAFDQLAYDKAFRMNIGEVRHTALSYRFQKNMEQLRGAMADFGFMREIPVHLAYFQLVGYIVDFMVLMTPFYVTWVSVCLPKFVPLLSRVMANFCQ